MVVTATYPLGASDNTVVTIQITDEDKLAETTVNAGESVGGS